MAVSYEQILVGFKLKRGEVRFRDVLGELLSIGIDLFLFGIYKFMQEKEITHVHLGDIDELYKLRLMFEKSKL